MRTLAIGLAVVVASYLLQWMTWEEPVRSAANAAPTSSLYASEWYGHEKSEKAYSRVIVTTERGLLAFWTVLRSDAHQPPRSRFPSLEELKAGSSYFPGKVPFRIESGHLVIDGDVELEPGLQGIANEHGILNPWMVGVSSWDGLKTLELRANGDLSVIARTARTEPAPLYECELPTAFTRLASQ